MKDISLKLFLCFVFLARGYFHTIQCKEKEMQNDGWQTGNYNRIVNLLFERNRTRNNTDPLQAKMQIDKYWI